MDDMPDQRVSGIRIPDRLAVLPIPDSPLPADELEQLRERFRRTGLVARIDAPQLQRLVLAAESLHQELDPDNSTALLFARTRRNAFVYSLALQQLLKWRDSQLVVGSYHAGMPVEERQDVYARFLDKASPLRVLVATKAFGMGMDIPDIHWLAHLDVPGSLEDYLQEIGRAGRDPGKMALAGVEQVPCRLFGSDKEFAEARGFLQSGMLRYHELQDFLKLITDYARKFSRHGRARKDAALIYPLQLAEQQFRRSMAQKQPLALHWLERLGRIKLGFYAPPVVHLVRKLPLDQLSGIRDCDTVLELIGPGSSKGTSISTARLQQQTGCAGLPALFKLLSDGERRGLWSILDEVCLQPERGKVSEIESSVEHSALPPDLEFRLRSSRRLIDQLSTGALTRLTLPELQDRLKEWLEADRDRYSPGWISAADSDQYGRLRQEWSERFRLRMVLQLRPLFFLLRMILGLEIHHEYDPAKGLIYVFSCPRKRTTGPLDGVEHVLMRLLATCIEPGSKSIAIGSLLRRLDCSFEVLEAAVAFLHVSQYLMSGTLFGRAIQLQLLNSEPVTPDREEDQGAEQGFREQSRLKELRLTGLELLYHLPKQRQQGFVSGYFNARSAEDLQKVIEGEIEADINRQAWDQAGKTAQVKQLLEALSGSRLAREMERLNDEQRQCVCGPVDRHQLVVAGAGTGKTRSLILRCAWLILEQQVHPAEILVLAYNRSVVLEVRRRIRALFRDLCILGMAEQVRVQTIHGYARSVIGKKAHFLSGNEFCQVLESIAGRTWGEALIRQWEAANDIVLLEGRWKPGSRLAVRRVTSQNGEEQVETGFASRPEMWIPWAMLEVESERHMVAWRHILLDEMQDLTSPRLDFLKAILNPGKVSLYAVGDPNQSIYGYQRELLNDPISPHRMIDRLSALLESGLDRRHLQLNYRSLKSILDAGRDVLPESPALRTVRLNQDVLTKGKQAVSRVEEGTGSVNDLLLRLAEERVKSGDRYSHIGLLFRTNEELESTRLKIDADDRFHNRRYQLRDLRITTDQSFAYLDQCREWKLVRHELEAKSGSRDGALAGEELRRTIAGLRKAMPWVDTERLALIREAVNLQAEEDPAQGATPWQQVVEELLREPLTLLSELRARNSGAGRKFQRVTLSTVHRAKGLEFDAVVLPPSRMRLDNCPEHIEEECRVRHVGITRSRTRLLLIEGPREAALSKRAAWQSNGSSSPVIRDLSDVYISGLVRGTGNVAAARILDSQMVIERLHTGTALHLVDNTLCIENGQPVCVLSTHFMKNLAEYRSRRNLNNGVPIQGFRVQTVIWNEVSQSDRKDWGVHEVLIEKRGHWLVVPAGMPVEQ